MTSITKILLGATAGAAILASSVITASAAIVCSGSGNTCWHVQERYTYPPSAGVVIHEDDCGRVQASPSASMKAAAIGMAIAGRTFK